MPRLDPLGALRRTHFCGDLRASDVGREVVLCGWVRKRRDHGGVIFVDLRDRTGITQIVFKPDTQHEAHEKAQSVRAEWVLVVRGVVTRRDGGGHVAAVDRIERAAEDADSLQYLLIRVFRVLRGRYSE